MSQELDTYDEEDSVLFMGPTLSLTEMKKIFSKTNRENQEKTKNLIDKESVNNDDEVEIIYRDHEETPGSSAWGKKDSKDYIEILDDSDSTSGIASSNSFSSYKCRDADKVIIVHDEDSSDNIDKGTLTWNKFYNIDNIEKQLSDQTAPEDLYKSILLEEEKYQSKVCDQSAPEGLYSTTFNKDQFSRRDFIFESPNKNETVAEQSEADITLVGEEKEEIINISEESNYVAAPRLKSRLTIFSPPTWRKGSDESFERWEKLSEESGNAGGGEIMIDDHSIPKDIMSSDEQQSYNTARNNPLERESDESITPTVYGTAQNSDESTHDQIYHTARNSPISVRSSRSKRYSKQAGDYAEKNYSEGANTSTDSLNSNNCSSRDVSGSELSYNTSREFNDTLEEMDYLLNKAEAFEKTQKNIKNGSNIISTPDRSMKKSFFFTPPETEYITKDLTKTNRARYFFSPVNEDATLTPSEPKQKMYPFTPTNSPSTKYAQNSASKTFTKSGTPLFKVPLKPRSGYRPFTTARSPVKSNYGNIVSPIGMYISRSANVPLTNTVRADPAPKRHLIKMNKFTHPELYSQASKENTDAPNNKPHSPAALPIRAYKSSAITNVNDQKSPGLIGPGKSDKIRKLIEATPSHEILRHQQRLKDPLGTRLPTRSPLIMEEDSFANMSLSSAEVSVYVAKEPLRTNTLENKKI